MRIQRAAALLCVLPALASADDRVLGDLQIINPRAIETAATAQTGVGYLTIGNTGETDDALIAVEADFPKVMLHESVEQDGVASMRHVDRVDLPAGGMIELAPGGLHVMFMGLGGDPFEAGEEIPATLVFEKAGPLKITFKVEPRFD